MKNNLREIMIPFDQYPIISEDVLFEEAVNLLAEVFIARDSSWHNYGAVFTINSSAEVTGILTFRKALKVMEYLNYSNNRNNLLRAWITKFKLGNLKVKNFTRPLKKCQVNIDTNLEEAITFALQRNLNSLVITRDHKVVGVIRLIDLFWYIENVL